MVDIKRKVQKELTRLKKLKEPMFARKSNLLLPIDFEQIQRLDSYQKDLQDVIKNPKISGYDVSLLHKERESVLAFIQSYYEKRNQFYTEL